MLEKNLAMQEVMQETTLSLVQDLALEQIVTLEKIQNRNI